MTPMILDGSINLSDPHPTRRYHDNGLWVTITTYQASFRGLDIGEVEMVQRWRLYADNGLPVRMPTEFQVRGPVGSRAVDVSYDNHKLLSVLLARYEPRNDAERELLADVMPQTQGAL